MKINFQPVVKGINNAARQTMRFVKKNKRIIGSVASAGMTIGGTIWACKKTLDIQPTIHGLRWERDIMTEKSDIRKSVAKEIGVYAKAYAGPAACIIGGQAAHLLVEHSMAVENASLAAGIGVLQSQVKNLTKEHPVEEAKENEELPKYAVKDASIIGLSPYAVLFDENHPLWNENPIWRYREIHAAQMSINVLLRRRAQTNDPKKARPMLMNDIYQILSYPDTELGSHGGYFYDPVNHPEADNNVDFLFYDAETKQLITDFTDGITRPVWIDFNVDYGYVTNFLAKN